jgi:hypothetical protein
MLATIMQKDAGREDSRDAFRAAEWDAVYKHGLPQNP